MPAPEVPAPPPKVVLAPATSAKPALEARGPFRARVVAERPRPAALEGRAAAQVSRADLDRRQPRSTPDAVRYEPGVFVQQTAHGQGSVYLRGLTGYQTLMLFDGVRLNNATFRQGPNQYFFTLDARTIESIEILRGGGVTRFGSDALGGTLNALPIEPLWPQPDQRLRVEPGPMARYASADRELNGRAQLSFAYRRDGLRVGLIGGFGGRDVGQLKAGGPIENPNPNTPAGRYPFVPRFAADGKTQLGTGFRELAADLRLVALVHDRHRFTAAAYLYRQYDTPRTDQCPAPTAPLDSCLLYEQQFRHLVYATYENLHTAKALDHVRVTLSWQQQHERRRLDQPSLRARDRGQDDVDSLGLLARAESPWLARGPVSLRLAFGGDAYLDLVRSQASLSFTDTGDVIPRSRGQYLDGSRFLTSGLWTDGELRIGPSLVLRGGARVGLVRADAPADPESGTSPVASTWVPLAGRLGLDLRARDWLRLLVNIDHGFRAPNLNDLTARQQTGPGFQFENAALGPERATTFDTGLVFSAPSGIAALELWGYEMLLQGLILKVSRRYEDCPLQTPQCQASWSRFQLQNADALSFIHGAEAALRLRLPLRRDMFLSAEDGPRGALHARASLGYAYGEGPRLGGLPDRTPGVTLGDRVPLSRIPPLNGTAELWWARRGLSFGAALRWAAPQYRLAVADYADGRIPRYGTPGFAVLDLRAAVPIGGRVLLTAIFENVFDAAYRYHGSSVNGPGRGLILAARVL